MQPVFFKSLEDIKLQNSSTLLVYAHYIFRPTLVIFTCLQNCWWICCASVCKFSFWGMTSSMRPCVLWWWVVPLVVLCVAVMNVRGWCKLVLFACFKDCLPRRSSSTARLLPLLPINFILLFVSQPYAEPSSCLLFLRCCWRSVLRMQPLTIIPWERNPATLDDWTVLRLTEKCPVSMLPLSKLMKIKVNRIVLALWLPYLHNLF
jgi:hypothetical protein